MTTVLGLIILLASIIGHTEYWVILVNRLHAFRIHYRLLKVSRRLHDLAIVAYTLFAIGYALLTPRGLLQGGTLADQTSWMRWMLMAMWPGLLPWSFGILRWQMVQKRSFHAADHSERVNLLHQAKNTSERNAILGPRKHLSRLFPWNEIGELEINQKSMRVRRSRGPGGKKSAPVSEDRAVRMVHLSDLHFVGCPGELYYRQLFERAAAIRPHAFVFTGDLIDDPLLLPLAAELFTRLTSVAPCFFILGNHDWRYDFKAIRSEIVRTGWKDVAGITTAVQLGGHSVVIGGNELPWLGKAPPDVSGVDADLRLLLSHSPDQLGLARRQGYDVMLAGHTHGGQVVLPVIGPVYAPSRYGVRFASGLFEAHGLHLHVSRGVGGKDPLRWNCPPELTCLQIHLP